MQEIYSELTLYAGIIPNNGVREGRFDKPAVDEFSQMWRSDAMKQVNRALDAYHSDDKFEKFVNRIEYCWYPFVQDKGEAKQLVDFLAKNYQNSQPLITLIDSMHGNLRFFRRIRFDRMIESDKPSFVERVNSTGLGPIRYRSVEGKESDEELTWTMSFSFFPKK